MECASFTFISRGLKTITVKQSIFGENNYWLFDLTSCFSGDTCRVFLAGGILEKVQKNLPELVFFSFPPKKMNPVCCPKSAAAPKKEKCTKLRFEERTEVKKREILRTCKLFWYFSVKMMSLQNSDYVPPRKKWVYPGKYLCQKTFFVTYCSFLPRLQEFTCHHSEKAWLTWLLKFFIFFIFPCV